ncbi:MAG: hypothetical protein JEY79_12225 [Pseudodesulfovibrio sp.]|nr:hypothetical protein [Pseudodesulfovibrio sp.]
MKLSSLIIALFILSACTTTNNTAPSPGSLCSADSNTLDSQWYNQKHTYRLRHGGILQLREKTIPITGFMVLDTNSTTADVVILAGLGIKLATLKISQDSYKIVYASPVARRIPHFFEQCAFSIQHTFLKGFPKEESPCSMVNGMREYVEETLEGTLHSRIDPLSDSMTDKVLESNNKIWTVQYQGTTDINNTRFPEKVTFNHITRNYTVILRLKSAEIQ